MCEVQSFHSFERMMKGKNKEGWNKTFGAGIIFLILAHPVYKM